MRTLKLYIHYKLTGERFSVQVRSNQTVGELVNYINEYFQLGASYVGTEESVTVLNYLGGDLKNDWILGDLNIHSGETLKCYLKVEKVPDYLVYIKFRNEYYKYFDDNIDMIKFTVYDLRVKLSQILGYPLSLFHLRPSDENKNVEMLDDHRLIDYGIDRYGHLVLETWIGMENFLNSCIRGYHKQVIKTMSSDEIIRQYQAKVALFLAAHYGHYDLANSMMNLGARPDRPVGEHPSRQWCANLNSKKPEYLRCPIHEAIKSGQLKIVTLFSKDLWVLQEPDGFGVLPWRLALRNDHKDPVKNEMQKDVARFLINNQYSGKIKYGNHVLSNTLYYKLKSWADRAKEKVLVSHGLAKTSYKKKPFQLGALVGYKVLVDGYNNTFKDYPSMVDEIQSRNRLVYFKDEEEKKNTMDPELYFRTQNLALLKFGKPKPSKVSLPAIISTGGGNKETKKYEAKKLPESKARLKWRKIVAMVINQLFFVKITKDHGETLKELGFDIKKPMYGISEDDENKKQKIEKKLPPLKKLKSVSMNEFYSTTSTSKLETIEEKEKSKNKIKKAPATSMSLMPSTKLPKIKSETPSVLSHNEEKMRKSINQTSIENFPSLSNFNSNSVSSNYFKSSSVMNLDDLKEETLQCFVKYCDGLTPRDIAKKCLKEASLFNGKSWFTQFKMGVSMSTEQIKRSIFRKS